MTLLLSEKDVAGLVNMPAIIELTENALKLLSAGEVDQPVRGVVSVPSQSAFKAVMPAAMPNGLGTKIVTVFPHSEPSHLAIIALFDTMTGAPLAIMDGRLITEMRTAAASAVATRYMAREDAKVLAILGAGTQAESHLEALAQVRRLDRVIVWNRSAARAEQFKVKMAVHAFPFPIEILVASSAEAAVKEADIIATVTAASEPILAREWLKAGVHINAVGACRPNMREIDTATMQAAHIIVDKREAALQEAGDLLIPIKAGDLSEKAIQGELGEVAAGAIKGRPEPNGITLFESLGQAVEDVAVGTWVYQQALEQGIGQHFNFQ